LKNKEFHHFSRPPIAHAISNSTIHRKTNFFSSIARDPGKNFCAVQKMNKKAQQNIQIFRSYLFGRVK